MHIYPLISEIVLRIYLMTNYYTLLSRLNQTPPHAADRRRRARAEGARRRPARGLPALRAHAPRPRRVNGAGGPRQRNLRRLVHSLGDLNGELASKSDDLAQLVDSSSAVFRAFASEQANITRAVGDLPARAAPDDRHAGQGPDVRRDAAARPRSTCARRCGRSTAPTSAVQPVRQGGGADRCANEIRPFVREARPVVRATSDAGATSWPTPTPDLTRSFTVLNHLFNLAAYNPNGREDPDKDGREEGYLFWIAWVQHTAPRCSRPPTPTARSAR